MNSAIFVNVFKGKWLYWLVLEMFVVCLFYGTVYYRWSIFLIVKHLTNVFLASWSWSYDSWIYNFLCNQCLSPLMLWVRILIRARCTTLCDKVCQWLATGRWFSPTRTVSDLTEWYPPLAIYDVQTLEYRYISQLSISPSKF
jgi:hypothetical protein